MPAYRPWTTRTIGVEMELNRVTTAHAPLTLAQVAQALTASVVAVGQPASRVRNVGGYTHSNGTTWDCKTDGSCGFEIASPALRLDDEGENAEMKAVCEGINRLSPRVDRTCGLHVWVDTRDFSWQEIQKLVALWVRYEPFFFEMVPNSRKSAEGNSYCAGLRKESWTGSTTARWRTTERALQARTQDEWNQFAGGMYSGRGNFEKYSALNISRWWQNGMVEFRLHSGTLDYAKIRNWCKLLTAVVNRVKAEGMSEIRTAVNISAEMDAARANGQLSVVYMARILGLSRTRGVTEVPESNRDLLRWMEERRAKFARIPRRDPRHLEGERAYRERQAADPGAGGSVTPAEAVQAGRLFVPVPPDDSAITF